MYYIANRKFKFKTWAQWRDNSSTLFYPLPLFYPLFLSPPTLMVYSSFFI